MTRGALILIEGLDRAGKSSQCELLLKRLKSDNVEVQLLKFPDRTTNIGKMINEYLTSTSSSLSDQAIHLLFSANRWEVSGKLLQLLDSGTTVILDRYFYSGIAFSAAKDVPGMTLDWCKNPEIGLPLPDVTIFLDVSEEVAQKRGGYGMERYEKVEFQKKVRSKFFELKSDKWCVLSADASLEDVQHEIYQKVSETVKNLGPIKKFE
jgi:dTMP kinase